MDLEPPLMIINEVIINEEEEYEEVRKHRK